MLGSGITGIFLVARRIGRNSAKKVSIGSDSYPNAGSDGSKSGYSLESRYPALASQIRTVPVAPGAGDAVPAGVSGEGENGPVSRPLLNDIFSRLQVRNAI